MKHHIYGSRIWMATYTYIQHTATLLSFCLLFLKQTYMRTNIRNSQCMHVFIHTQPFIWVCTTYTWKHIWANLLGCPAYTDLNESINPSTNEIKPVIQVRKFHFCISKVQFFNFAIVCFCIIFVWEGTSHTKIIQKHKPNFTGKISIQR